VAGAEVATAGPPPAARTTCPGSTTPPCTSVPAATRSDGTTRRSIITAGAARRLRAVRTACARVQQDLTTRGGSLMGRTGRADAGRGDGVRPQPQGQRNVRRARRATTPPRTALCADKVTGLRSRRRGSSERRVALTAAASDPTASRWFLDGTGMDDRQPRAPARARRHVLPPPARRAPAAVVGDRVYFTDWRGDPDERLLPDGPTVAGCCASWSSARRGARLVWRSHSDLCSSAPRRTSTSASSSTPWAGRCCSTSGCGGRLPPPEAVVLRHRGAPERDSRSSGGSTCATAPP
jgi:hypothetical protein